VIGIEVHCQLRTASKMFCGCSTAYDGAAPNTHVCPVCLGLPGALPVINKRAVELVLATGAAVETIDECLGRVATAVAEVDGRHPDGPGSLLAITADHGNADKMRDEAGHPVTAHSLNPVPIVLVGRAVEGRRLRDGVLADVAPTLLELAGLPRWEGMTGRSLLLPAADGRTDLAATSSLLAGSATDP